MPHKTKEARLEYQKLWRTRNPELEITYNRKWLRSPKGRFSKQRSHAKDRGIEFLLTFEEWWSLWEPYWHRRGCTKDSYVMARFGDTGPYKIGNVRIITQSENASEAAVFKKENNKTCHQEMLLGQSAE